MANVKVNMDTGSLSMKGQETAEPRMKLRLKSVPDDMRERLRELDRRKQALAEARGAWKDATPKQRAEAKEVARQIRDLKAEMRAAAEAQRQAELDKQAAAAKREAERRGK